MLPGFKIAMSKSGEHVGTNRWCLCVDICRMAAVRGTRHTGKHLWTYKTLE